MPSLISEKMTDRCRLAVIKAMRAAHSEGEKSVTSIHLLVGIAYCENSLGWQMLEDFGVTNKVLDKAPPILAQITKEDQISPSDVVTSILQEAHGEAARGSLPGDGRTHYVGTDHLLLGIIKTKCKARELLISSGVDIDAMHSRTWQQTGVGVPKPDDVVYDRTRKIIDRMLNSGGHSNNIMQAIARIIHAYNIPRE